MKRAWDYMLALGVLYCVFQVTVIVAVVPWLFERAAS